MNSGRQIELCVIDEWGFIFAVEKENAIRSLNAEHIS